MSWEIMLKANYTNANLPMLKEMIHQLLEDIPEGTIFQAVQMWDKFLTYKPSDPKISRAFNHWAKHDKAKRWFKIYFGAYGIRIGKLAWHRKWKSEYIRLD
tara:strand:- start:1930 stop:2232 length:303 start_codon:yes stop_codon:yes gene_type:complete